MSACGQTEEDGVAEEMGAPVRDIYEHKSVSTVVRVLTVLAYLLSVSLAAILLSVYYVCVWKSPELPLANDTLEASARRQQAADRFLHAAAADDLHNAGGSNTSVSENVTQALNNITDGLSSAAEPAATSDSAALADLTDAAGFTDTPPEGVGDNGAIT